MARGQDVWSLNGRSSLLLPRRVIVSTYWLLTLNADFLPSLGSNIWLACLHLVYMYIMCPLFQFGFRVTRGFATESCVYLESFDFMFHPPALFLSFYFHFSFFFFSFLILLFFIDLYICCRFPNEQIV
jgi:hypothetical protein